MTDAMRACGRLGILAAAWLGCETSVLEPIETAPAAAIDPPPGVTTADKVDLLFVIDNSRSMADKQAILAAAVSELVSRLSNPLCRNSEGWATTEQPAGPLDGCPSGEREFAPIGDIHIGVVTSSLGGHGSDSCPNEQQVPLCDPYPNYTNNDRGRLVFRLDPYGTELAPTYEDKGFLAWDPQAELEPPGEANAQALRDNLSRMIVGAGQIGCGFESQLESWYRFLVDPEPYASISVVNGEATPAGIDETLLAQRRAFARPDSLLAIILLTDENDCSLKESGQSYFAAQVEDADGTPVRMPRPRTICQSKPNDPCCASCLQQPEDAAGKVCPDDPICAEPFLDDWEDPMNLRCWDQKRRFGIDFLHPIDRYVEALSAAEVSNRAGELVPNPLFADFDPSAEFTKVRDPSLVFLAAVVGVPWQDIARDPADLSTGYKSADALAADGTWDLIVGDPVNGVPPADPLMLESTQPRAGINPPTGAPLVSPGGSGNNPINGHELIAPNNDDLQYACIFPLPEPLSRDCTQPCQACDCGDPLNDNPLCAADPVTGAPTFQVRAKAYPGLRPLAVARGLGAQGIVASVCAAQVLEPERDDFGYRPAVAAILERIVPRLRAPERDDE